MNIPASESPNVEASFSSPRGKVVRQSTGSPKPVPPSSGSPNVEASFSSPRGDAVPASAARDGRSLSPIWRRKPHRLSADVYVGPNAYFVTIATALRAPRFADCGTAATCERELVASAARHGFDLLAYVFMPDHLHALAQGTDGSSLPAFVSAFKQKTSYAFRKTRGERLWQKGYHDRILRGEDDLADIAGYIIDNPREAGLTEEPFAYPYLGGSLIEATRGDLKVASTSGVGSA